MNDGFIKKNSEYIGIDKRALQDCDQEHKLTEHAPKSYGTLKETVDEVEIENNEPALLSVITR